MFSTHVLFDVVLNRQSLDFMSLTDKRGAATKSAMSEPSHTRIVQPLVMDKSQFKHDLRKLGVSFFVVEIHTTTTHMKSIGLASSSRR